MLKPMLARGELHCIGATTLDEYRQVHREGRRPGAPLPAQVMVRSRPSRTPSPSCAASRSATRCTTASRSGRGPDRGGHAVQPLHHRPLPARQGHRPRRRGLRHDPHRDGLHAAELDDVCAARSCSTRSRRPPSRRRGQALPGAPGRAPQGAGRPARRVQRHEGQVGEREKGHRQGAEAARERSSRRLNADIEKAERSTTSTRPPSSSTAPARPEKAARRAGESSREPRKDGTLLRDKVTEEEIARRSSPAGPASPWPS
jgi:hypothetical protein